MTTTDASPRELRSYRKLEPARTRAPWKRALLMALLLCGLSLGGHSTEHGLGCRVIEALVIKLTELKYGTFDERTRSEPGANLDVVVYRPADLSPGARFGAAVSAGGNAVVVGAPMDAPVLQTTGSVYVFSGNGGPFKIIPDDVGFGARFGEAVAVPEGSQKDVLAIGAPGVGLERGAVFLYTLSEVGGEDEWTLSDIIESPEFTDPRRFGQTLRMLNRFGGDVALIVGAPGLVEDGAVHVYRVSGGRATHELELRGDPTVAGNAFGNALAYASSYLLIGAPGEPVEPGQTGAAYLYQFDSNPTQVAKRVKLTAAAGATTQQFGFSTAFHENDNGRGTGDVDTFSAFCGAPRTRVGEPETGGWVHHRYFEDSISSADTPDVTTSFDLNRPLGSAHGSAIAVQSRNNGYLAVGAPATRVESTSVPGEVTLYKMRSELSQTVFATVLQATEPIAGDQFGFALEFDGEDLFVGAPAHGSAGAVFGIPKENFPIPAAKPKPDLPPPARYLGFRADDDAPEPASARTLLATRLRAPFRAEITVGAFDADLSSVIGGAETGVCLARAGDDDEAEFELVAQFVGSDVVLTAGPPGSAVGTPVVFAGARTLDLAVQHDGDTLHFLARPEGDGDYEEVATIPEDGGTFLPGMFVRDLPAGQELGFGAARLVESADLPDTAPAFERASDLLFRALALEGALLSELEAASVDADDLNTVHVEPSRALLARAADLLKEASRAATDKHSRKRFKKARSQAKKADRSVRGAGKKLLKGKARAKVVKLVEKALKAEGKALAGATE